MLASIALLVVAAATGALVFLRGDDGGANSSQAVADEALRALSAKNEAGLLRIANPSVPGREDDARQLVDRCRASDFGSATVTVRGGFGDDVAWADIAVPKGLAGCQQVTLTLSRIDGGWYLGLGSAEVPGLGPSASTDR